MSTKDLVALPSDNAATWRSFDGVLEWEDELRGVGHYSSPGSAGVSVYLAGSTAFIEMPSGRGDVILDDHSSNYAVRRRRDSRTLDVGSVPGTGPCEPTVGRSRRLAHMDEIDRES